MSKTFAANDLPGLLADLKRQRFYGRLSFDIKDGDVALIRKEETLLVNHNHSDHHNDNSSGTKTTRNFSELGANQGYVAGTSNGRR